MVNILRQRFLFVTKIFEITDNSLKVRTSRPFNYFEGEFAFENITKRVVWRKKVNRYILFATVGCLIGLCITIFSHLYEKDGSSVSDILFYTILSIPFLAAFFLTYVNIIYLYLHDGRCLAFYGHLPKRIKVETFINELFTKQKEYLLDRYARADPYLSDEQVGNNLKWLWDRKIISDAELSELRAQLLPDPNIINRLGFKFYPSAN